MDCPPLRHLTKFATAGDSRELARRASFPSQAGRRPPRGRLYVLVPALVWCVLLAIESPAHDIPVPIEIHLPICVKALAFDRGLRDHAGDEIVFGILYQRRFLSSKNAHDEAVRVLEAMAVDEIDGAPVRYVSIPVGREEDIERAVLDSEADVVYVMPLRAIATDVITDITRRHDRMTCSGVGAYEDVGFTLTIGARGGKPELVVNLTAMREEGVAFTAQLLGIARVIHVPERAANPDGEGGVAR